MSEKLRKKFLRFCHAVLSHVAYGLRFSGPFALLVLYSLWFDAPILFLGAMIVGALLGLPWIIFLFPTFYLADVNHPISHDFFASVLPGRRNEWSAVFGWAVVVIFLSLHLNGIFFSRIFRAKKNESVASIE